MTGLGLSPLPPVALGLLVLAGGGLEFLLRQDWLSGVVTLITGAGFVSLALLRSAILRAGVKLGQELGQIEGHHQARTEMYCSLREAQARGMSPTQWLETEVDRDRGENRG